MTITGRVMVRSAIAPLLAEPRASSPQVSQRLAGHALDVVEVQGDWLRVRGGDAYEGWVHTGYIASAPERTARQSHGGRRVSLGCVTGISGGGRRSLPLGAFLGPEETVQSGEILEETAFATRFPGTAAAIARSATEFFEGTSYQWGGITPWGADCSGFVQSIFALHGVPLPRDAWQQAQVGEPVERKLAALQVSELAFFSDRDDGRITHVGLGVGSGRMAHVAVGRGGFAVERLADARDGYVKTLVDQFRFVRRVV
ncbi:MAG: SH3 domain-containing C40 family peptidase [Gemmatimonadaceae bacterium]|nr:NlpC/P60 family protein [Gemmatimonadaceae bacterium]